MSAKMSLSILVLLGTAKNLKLWLVINHCPCRKITCKRKGLCVDYHDFFLDLCGGFIISGKNCLKIDENVIFSKNNY